MKQFFVHGHAGNIQIALLENGRLMEYDTEQQAAESYIGQIYRGTVMNVVPGLQAAFVHIGLDKNGYIYVDDLLPAHLERQPDPKPCISEILNVGDSIIVQVKKDPIGTKGARLTTHYSLTGRWVVYMPEAAYVTVSRKIMQSAERQRLTQIGEACCQQDEGMIIRTIAEGQAASAIEQDVRSLRALWQSLQEKVRANAAADRLLYRELSFVPRLARDIFTTQQTEWIVENTAMKEWLATNLSLYVLEWPSTIRTTQEVQLSSAWVSEEWERLQKRKIWLKCGGYIVVDETEALIVIDVNSGKNTKLASLAETILETNLNATEEIARLLRLRDLGGMIIIDYIDMEQEKDRQQVQACLEQAVANDRTKTIILGWTKLGLMELTRKKLRASKSLHASGVECKHCGAVVRNDEL